MTEQRLVCSVRDPQEKDAALCTTQQSIATHPPECSHLSRDRSVGEARADCATSGSSAPPRSSVVGACHGADIAQTMRCVFCGGQGRFCDTTVQKTKVSTILSSRTPLYASCCCSSCDRRSWACTAPVVRQHTSSACHKARFAEARLAVLHCRGSPRTAVERSRVATRRACTEKRRQRVSSRVSFLSRSRSAADRSKRCWSEPVFWRRALARRVLLASHHLPFLLVVSPLPFFFFSQMTRSRLLLLAAALPLAAGQSVNKSQGTCALPPRVRSTAPAHGALQTMTYPRWALSATAG